jgi:peptidoglycan/xylan/chitin deacetylase (PgdA/CDA1 family)
MIASSIISLFFLTHMVLATSTSLSVDTDAIRSQSNTPQQTVMWHMPRHAPQVALTFDDGPDETVTPQLLNVLREHNVTATFFLVGHMMAKAPHVVRQIARDGHVLANHTWAHYRLDEQSLPHIERQLASTTAVFESLGVTMAPYVRPPGGRFNDYVVRAAKDQGLTMVMWDVNAADYRRPNGQHPHPDAIVARVLRGVRPGSIVLMHNGPATVAALPRIITALKKKSYRMGPLTW